MSIWFVLDVVCWGIHIVSTARCLESTKNSDVMSVAESDHHNACQESRGESVAPACMLLLTKHGKDLPVRRYIVWLHGTKLLFLVCSLYA